VPASGGRKFQAQDLNYSARTMATT
jgi:hypothetical protein